MFMIKNELVSFFYQNYPGIKEQRSIEDVSEMFERFDGQYCFKYKNGRVEFLALYLMVNDEWIDEIERNPNRIGEPGLILECLQHKGKNLHFIVALGPGSGNILSCLKDVIRRERPDSVSWLKEDMKIHWIKERGLLCQS